MKIFAFILILMFSISRYNDISCLYLEPDNIFGALSYQFVHLSLFHLLTNIYFIYLYWKAFDFRPLIFVSAYIISVLSGFYLQSTVPTVGASGIAFSLVGFFMASSFSFDKKYLKTILLLLLFISLQGLLNKSVHCMLHFVCLITAFLIYIPWTLKK